MIEYQKVKSVSKRITTKGSKLSKTVLDTMRTISDIVGATLGPGGRQVSIERFEHAIPPMLTKDGVTVFRSLGFENAEAHCIMECARDAAVRTASEAGDGTTTATVLAEALVRLTSAFCDKHLHQRPQKVVRHLEKVCQTQVIPALQKLSIAVDSTSDEGRKLLRNVAKVSANGDDDLADAVMKCFDLVGDDGNVTIVESSGSSHYEVEQIDGFPIAIGYEDSCAKFYPKFINDSGRQMSTMEDPVFVLYHGTLTEVQSAYILLSKVGDAYEMLLQGQQKEYDHHNVVFVAVGFSEQVLATFASGWDLPNAIKIFPLVIPKSPLANFQTQFLEDLSAITGATIFDPINKPFSEGTLEDLGPGTAGFEASRFRSVIIGRAANKGEPWETQLIDQIDIVQTQLERPESDLDKYLLQERLGKLTGGIAKLRVVGSSNGELKERRDRAEDAVCAVRGAIKHGCLPGGGWALMKAVASLDKSDPVIAEVLAPALMEPVYRLYNNCGMSEVEMKQVLDPILEAMRDGKVVVFDAMENRHGDAVELGILDSTPAVTEAVRSSVSIAALLGTLGGMVVFARDHELERSEARATQQWLRDANVEVEP